MVTSSYTAFLIYIKNLQTLQVEKNFHQIKTGLLNNLFIFKIKFITRFNSLSQHIKYDEIESVPCDN